MSQIEFPCVSSHQLKQDLIQCALAAHRLRLDVTFTLAAIPPNELPPLAEKLEEVANIYLELAERLSALFVIWRREEHALSERTVFEEMSPD